MAQKGPKKDIKRAKIELKDDPSIDTKTASSLFDKTMIENKDTFITIEELKKIYSSNKSFGDAISSIFQVQLDFAHILIEFLSEMTNSKKDDKDKSMTTNGEVSAIMSNFDSVKFGKGILTSYFKLERIERDITTLLTWNRREKEASNKSSFVKSTRTSPPLSARVWESKIKRSSVPQVLTEPKTHHNTEEGSPKPILPAQAYKEKVIQDPKPNSKFHISLNKIHQNSPKRSPQSGSHLIENSKFLSTKLLSPQNNKIKSSVSPQRKVETQTSNPPSHRDLRPDKVGFSEYLTQPKTKPLTSPQHENSKGLPLKTHHKNLSTNPRVPSLNINKDPQFERKLSTKPYIGELAPKELGEDNPFMEITGDEKMQSRETTNLMDDSNRTFRTDIEDKQQHKTTNLDPSKQKAIIKDMFKEEIPNYPGGFPKAHEGNVHQRKFLVDSKWIRSWRDFVNFDVDDEPKSILDLRTYSKPSKILNKNLLKSDIILDLRNMSADLELKDNLLEHHDFEALPQKAFDQLAKWYGCDFEISRFLRPDPFRNNKLFLDLYPNRPNRNKQYESNKTVSEPKPQVTFNNSENKVIKDIISSNLTNPFKKKK